MYRVFLPTKIYSSYAEYLKNVFEIKNANWYHTWFNGRPLTNKPLFSKKRLSHAFKFVNYMPLSDKRPRSNRRRPCQLLQNTKE